MWLRIHIVPLGTTIVRSLPSRCGRVDTDRPNRTGISHVTGPSPSRGTATRSKHGKVIKKLLHHRDTVKHGKVVKKLLHLRYCKTWKRYEIIEITNSCASFCIQQQAETETSCYITILKSSPIMTCICLTICINCNNFKQKVADLQNFKVGHEFWKAYYRNQLTYVITFTYKTFNQLLFLQWSCKIKSIKIYTKIKETAKPTVNETYKKYKTKQRIEETVIGRLSTLTKKIYMWKKRNMLSQIMNTRRLSESSSTSITWCGTNKQKYVMGHNMA